jgi:hypothetical protein
MASKNYSKVFLLVRSSASSIFNGFVDPKMLGKFWLKRSSGPLELGTSVKWEFMVSGASEMTTAEKLRPDKLIVFHWSDGIRVKIEIEAASRSSSVVRILAGPFGSASKAVDATEGFSIVLCDLKILLETGKSPGLVKDKARLIARASAPPSNSRKPRPLHDAG